MEFRIDLNPVPASRPRVSRWSTYYKGPYKEFRETLAKILDQILKKAKVKLQTGPLEVTTWFYALKPKTTKKLWPKGDIDNYQKATYDCLNTHVWEDDDIICSAHAHKRFSKEDHGYIIVSFRKMDLKELS